MALPNLGASPRAVDMPTDPSQRDIRSNERDYLLEGNVHGAVDIDVSAGGTVTPTIVQRLENGFIRFTGSPATDPVLEIPETALQIELANDSTRTMTTTAADGELLLESVDSLLLEDGSGVLLLEAPSSLVPAGETRILFKDGDVFRSVGRVGLQSGALLHGGGVDPTGNINFADFVLARPEMRDVSLTVATPSSSSNVLTLDMENGNVFDVTLTEDVTTLNLNNPPDHIPDLLLEDGSGGLLLEDGSGVLLREKTDQVGLITLVVTQDGTGGWDTTWPASVKWPKNTTSRLLRENGIQGILLEDGSGSLVLEPFEDSALITTALAKNIVMLKTLDAGVTWYAVISFVDIK